MRATARRVSPLEEARNYEIAQYPSVKFHLRCDETSGLFIRDEVSGLKIQPYQPPDYPGGSLTFAGPAYSVLVNPNDSQPPNLEGAYPTFYASKFYLGLLVFRSRNSGDPALPGGSNSYNGEIAIGTRQGLHLTVTDGVESASIPGFGGTVVAGNDYALAFMLRPPGQSYECGVYNLDGTQPFASKTVLNPGIGDITPTNINGGAAQADWYQKILYQFDIEPTEWEILTAIKWHGATAPQGIKAPYPGWKHKT